LPASTRSPTSAYCPTSKQPELKHAAVKILKAELPWSLLAVAWLAPDEALHAREEFKQVMTLFPFASCVPFGRERYRRIAARCRA
jgi:assimilatory nitrate reductase catalytic subunit